ncbi:MAG: DUF1858 domain-containing protein [Ignavibacteriales bacterium]|nr:DUF1858 domain-containing protein [Ignavibacteriales bacterium]
MNKLQITPETKVSDLLNNYPELEDKLIEIAPPFKKLKNPILRKTIAKVTTLRQASKVGGVSLAELINQLRIVAGQGEIKVEENKKENPTKPNWVIDENIKITYDARIDLENGAHPIAKVSKEILTLNKNDIYLLITPFLPGPLIDIVKEKGFEVFSENKSVDEVYTYIVK